MITHLAETSVLTRRTRPEVASVLGHYWAADALARCTLSDLEIGFSASNTVQWDDVQHTLGTLPAVDVTEDAVRRAKVVQRMLAERGLKGRKVPDLLIAAAAEMAQLTILHYDQDFELIASVTGQRHQWVVPRGTLD